MLLVFDSNLVSQFTSAEHKSKTSRICGVMRVCLELSQVISILGPIN